MRVAITKKSVGGRVGEKIEPPVAHHQGSDSIPQTAGIESPCEPTAMCLAQTASLFEAMAYSLPRLATTERVEVGRREDCKPRS